VLPNVFGDENHLHEMDFKVADTDRGVTSLRADIEIQDNTKEVVGVALAQAHEARVHVLKTMNETVSH
jgi:polyribonucleotide nucleotidyltransferase